MKFSWENKEMTYDESHPARGAWIEIDCKAERDAEAEVAPRKGCVD